MEVVSIFRVLKCMMQRQVLVASLKTLHFSEQFSYRTCFNWSYGLKVIKLGIFKFKLVKLLFD